MAIKVVRPTSPGRRHMSVVKDTALSKSGPLKRLTTNKRKITGRNNQGKITIRHRGGAQKRRLRLIDFKRDKREITGKVIALEYDPNRTTHIALVTYTDGDKRYIIAPVGLKVGQTVVAGEKADVEIGNALPLRQIPVGMPIHNLELRPGKGGQIVRSAGSAALIQSKEDKFAAVALPSKEIRLISLDCYATIGQVSNEEWKTLSIGKAGRKRHMGWRPSVRGVAQHPASHPHGGGEGRSGVGLKSPKTPWGKRAMGKKTRRAKYSNKYIIKDRRSKQ